MLSLDAPAGTPALSSLPSCDRRIRATLRRRGIRLSPEEGERPARTRARLETALMALFRDRRGDAEFEALHAYAGSSILLWVSSQLASYRLRLDPLELVQDVFVNIYRYAAGFRDEHPMSFRGWAQAICRNVVRRHASMRARHLLTDLPDNLQEPADLRPGPQRLAQSGEEELRFTKAWTIVLLHYRKAYAELSERDQAALEMVEVEGKSYAEACERLGVGMSNMKMIMFRARRRLRARMRRNMGLEATEEQPAHRLAG